MFVTRVPSKGKKNGKRYESVLLRESYRQKDKVKTRTLAVLTKLPERAIRAVEQAISRNSEGSLESLSEDSEGQLYLRQAESFGAVWAVNEVAKSLGIARALGVTRQGELGYWQVLARILRPGTSILGMVRLAKRCAAAAILKWKQPFNEDTLYANGAWLERRQRTIERRLWKEKLDSNKAEELFLYDVTSSYLEGQYNALGNWGYPRDGKKGKKQIVVGLLTDSQGDPCSIQLYEGNTSDFKTFGDQVHRLKRDLGAGGVTMVGDRGMIHSSQIEEAQEAGFSYITALTKPQIKKLLNQNTLQMELFEDSVSEVKDGAENRYVLRRNPWRAKEVQESRRQKKESIQQDLEKANRYLQDHPKAQVAVQERNLNQKIAKYNLSKWLSVHRQGRELFLQEDTEALEEESRLDGCYVITTDLPQEKATAEEIHDRYKDLRYVEQDFRTLKLGHLEFRPWFVTTEENTRAHGLTSMLALKIRRHLEQAWRDFDLTVEEGLRELEKWCVQEVVHSETGKVLNRIAPHPDSLQAQLLEALGLTPPESIPEAKVSVDTRTKLKNERK